MPSHADTHDLDKLKRWQKDLAAMPGDAPPVFAIFLVSEKDKRAHDVFRAYRTSFEARKLGFAHLVIFGQHGTSATERGVRASFGLEADSGPALVLFDGSSETPHAIPLPAGDAENSPTEDSDWRRALDRAESAMGAKSGKGPRVQQELMRLCEAMVKSSQT